MPGPHPPPVENETLGHQGRRDDPLYRIRKVLLTSERLDERGDNRMLLGLRVKLATELLDTAIARCQPDDVEEIASCSGSPAGHAACRESFGDKKHGSKMVLPLA